VNIQLPAAFLEYYAGEGPNEGSLLIDPGWFRLRPPEEISQINEEYQVTESAPGFIGFGSDGGGEMLAFDSRVRVFMLPFVPMSPEYAILIAESWEEFASKIESETLVN
jgi:hypothetical protein